MNSESQRERKRSESERELDGGSATVKQQSCKTSTIGCEQCVRMRRQGEVASSSSPVRVSSFPLTLSASTVSRLLLLSGTFCCSKL